MKHGSLTKITDEISKSFKLAAPLVLSYLVMTALNISPLVMLGDLGAKELAAATMGNVVFFPFYVFGVATMQAVSALTAQDVGSGKREQSAVNLIQGLWISLIFSLVMMTVLRFSNPIMLLLGQSIEVASLSSQYLDKARWGLFAAMGFGAQRSFVTAHGHSTPIFWTSLIALVVNILANYLLIFGKYGFPQLGIEGAGVANAMSQWTLFFGLTVFIMFKKKYASYQIYKKFFRSDWQKFFEILRVGLPIGFTVLAESGMFSMVGIMMGWVGTDALAAHGIVLQVVNILFTIPLGISQAAMIRVGLAYGAKNIVDIHKIGMANLGLGVLGGIFSIIIILAGKQFLLEIFIDQESKDYVRIAPLVFSLFSVGAIFHLVDCVQIIVVGALRGLKDTRVPLFFALTGYWIVGLGCSYLLGFPLGFGSVGIWSGLGIGLGWVALLGMWRFWGLPNGLTVHMKLVKNG